MPSAATSGPTASGSQHNVDAVREAYYGAHSKFRHGAALEVMKSVVTTSR